MGPYKPLLLGWWVYTLHMAGWKIDLLSRCIPYWVDVFFFPAHVGLPEGGKSNLHRFKTSAVFFRVLLFLGGTGDDFNTTAWIQTQFH